MDTISYEMLCDIAESMGGRPYPDYSGRGMYGSRCVGIVIDRHYYADDLADAIKGAGASEILSGKNLSEDSLGLNAIIYWKGVTCENLPDEDEDEDED